MKRALPVVAVALILLGIGLQFAPDALFASGPVQIVIVEETSKLAALPQSQIAMLNSPAVRKAMADKGHKFMRVDKDATGPDVPTWAIQAAQGKPLPAWVTRNKSGKVSVRACPTNETEALKCL